SITGAGGSSRPPAPVLTAHPANPVNTPGATFTFTDTESGVTFGCAIDGGSQTDCSAGSATYSGLTDGKHSFSVVAQRSTGAMSLPVTFVWTLDTVPPPVPSIDSHPGATAGAGAASFTFSDTEQSVTFLCRLDGAVPAACISPAS